MASRKRLTHVQKLKNDILALQNTHAETVAKLEENLQYARNRASEFQSTLDLLSSFFKGPREVYSREYDAVKYVDLPKLVLELSLYRSRNEGTVNGQYKLFEDMLDRQREVIRWFVNPDTTTKEDVIHMDGHDHKHPFRPM